MAKVTGASATFLAMLASRMVANSQCKKKWFQPEREVRVGDVVLLLSPDTPRGQWPLARIREVHAGKDGHVRVVKVQVGKTEFERPVTKICPLELGCDDEGEW